MALSISGTHNFANFHGGHVAAFWIGIRSIYMGTTKIATHVLNKTPTL